MVTTQTLVTLSASYSGVTKTTIFIVNPASAPAPALATLTLNPARVRGGTSATGTVTLSAPAPSAGLVVALRSTKPSLASVPASIVVAAGTKSKNFTVRTASTRRTNLATISASYAGVNKTATITVTRR